MRGSLSRDTLEFYSLRLKQYTKDFKEQTNQFKPRLRKLQKNLIASKQNADAPFSPKIFRPKKSKVLASLSKSSDIQAKVDFEMDRQSCKFSLSPIPQLSFSIAQSCDKVQEVILPIIRSVNEQLDAKQKQIELIERTNPNMDYQSHVLDFQKINEKKERLRKISEKLQQIQSSEDRLIRKTLIKIDNTPLTTKRFIEPLDEKQQFQLDLNNKIRKRFEILGLKQSEGPAQEFFKFMEKFATPKETPSISKKTSSVTQISTQINSMIHKKKKSINSYSYKI
ncbi:hypothetical protein pb186bvf_017464 [Paramecium bursaria]